MTTSCTITSECNVVYLSRTFYGNLKRKVNTYLNIKQTSNNSSRKIEVSKNYLIIIKFKVIRTGLKQIAFMRERRMHFPGIFTITIGVSLSFGCIFHAHSNLTMVCLRQVSSSCFHKTPLISWCLTFLSSTILFYSH